MNKYIISYTITGKDTPRDTKEFSTTAAGAIAKVRRYWKKNGRGVKVFCVTECGVQA
jgi:hypothetical protein